MNDQQPPPYQPTQYVPIQQYQPPQPQVIYTQNQSFTGKAVLVFLLYWLGWIPGLLFNIMFINEARRLKRETGRTPSGLGCLYATLVGSLVPAVLLVIVLSALVAAGQH